ncbi:ATP-dependent DNA helicase DDX31 [Centruroides vittatus]|uniref:ATP-dependent DNA helicase DDX31 n=1 Tax=Centruroides vittatus TaxID=120091 RepID=UPI00350EC1EE
MDLLINVTTDSVKKSKPSQKESSEKSEKLNVENVTSKKKPLRKKKKAQNIKVDNTKVKEGESKPVEEKLSTQVISSLFKHNPEIPNVKLLEVKQVEEPLFSNEEFSKLSLHPHLITCLRDRFSITKMTSVQQRTIPLILKGKDALVKSLTGSGKTLAYAIPIMQKLQAITPKLKRSDGIYAIVIVPTRELAIQSYECFEKLSRAFTWIVPGYLIGGEKKKSEKARIRKGITVLISTPGRLLDHIEHTSNLNVSNVRWLVIDEADRLFELGFEQSISKIVSYLAEHNQYQRQTILLSATLSKDVERLAGMSLVTPAIVDVSATTFDRVMSSDEFVVSSCLEQYFIIVPIKLRLVCLSAFIIDKCAMGPLKALIFMSTQDVVDYHFILFSDILQKLLKEIDISAGFFKLHGNMTQQERTQIFKEFRETRAGILLCTDVASRGLDLPKVDWIIQFSAPCKPEEYVHRVGRTARIGTHGQALLFLLPSEARFLKTLQDYKINLKSIKMEDLIKSVLLLEQKSDRRQKHSKTIEEHATNLQLKYENYVYGSPAVHEMGKKAFTSYARGYASYPRSLKHIFSIKELHLGHAAKSFCLREAPSVLGVSVSRNLNMDKNQHRKRGGFKRKFDHAFSEYDSGLTTDKKLKRQTHSVLERTFDKPKKDIKRNLAQHSEFDSGLNEEHKQKDDTFFSNNKYVNKKDIDYERNYTKAFQKNKFNKRNSATKQSTFSEFDSGLEMDTNESTEYDSSPPRNRKKKFKY